jgi:hypothetical protein
VSEKKGQRSSQAPANKRKGQRGNSSLVIPVVAGLVVLVLFVGAILAIENRSSRTSAKPGDVATPRSTLQAQPTSSIPYPAVPRIAVQEARDKLGQGQAVLIDVRSKASYDQEHARGALSMPETEIDAHLNELPRDKELILYCT